MHTDTTRNAERSPLGDHRTTFTAAECLLNVAKYSTRGGLGPLGAEVASTRVVGRILGWTIHICPHPISETRSDYAYHSAPTRI